MASFGEWLKSEREARHRTIEDIGSATGIQLSYLEALETNEFSALPGPAFGKLYIRAYAEILGLDPAPLMDQYNREQAARGRSASSPHPPEPTRPRRVEAAISDWRAARIAGRKKAPRADALVEEPPGAASETGNAAHREMAAEQSESTMDSSGSEAAESTELTGSEGIEPSGFDSAADATPELGSASPEPPGPLGHLAAPKAPLSPQPARYPRRTVVAVLLTGGFLLIVTGGYRIVFRSGRQVAAVSPSTSSLRKIPEDLKLTNPTASHAGSAVQPETTSVPESSNPPLVRREQPVPSPAGEGSLRPEASPGRSNLAKAAGAAEGTGPLAVPEFDLGHRIVNRRLEGRDEPFAVGEAVLFSTRVIGGQPGDTIRHVWIHEGRAVQSISLQLGGPDWRTHSRKTIRHAGAWSVEARDSQGRVLATAVLTAAPTARSQAPIVPADDPSETR